MPGHKEKPIMDMINSTVALQDKWNEMILKMENQLREQFKAALGVPLPTSIMCDVYHVESSATFAANANVDEYQKGATAIVTSGLKQNWPQVALDVIDTVAAIAKAVIGTGMLKVGMTADAHKIEANNPQKGDKTFFIACYTVVQHCTASDWKLDTEFFAASHALVVWAPTMQHVELISKNLAAQPNARFKAVGATT